MVFDVGPRGVREIPNDMSVKPSAVSSITCCGAILAEQEFEGETEAEVKASVEAWVAEQQGRVRRVLAEEFRRSRSEKGGGK